jgi:hypothetical protein
MQQAGVLENVSESRFWIQKNVGEFVRLELSSSLTNIDKSFPIYGKNFDNGIIRGVWSGLLPEQEGTFIGQNQDAPVPG